MTTESGNTSSPTSRGLLGAGKIMSVKTTVWWPECLPHMSLVAISGAKEACEATDKVKKAYMANSGSPLVESDQCLFTSPTDETYCPLKLQQDSSSGVAEEGMTMSTGVIIENFLPEATMLSSSCRQAHASCLSGKEDPQESSYCVSMEDDHTCGSGTEAWEMESSPCHLGGDVCKSSNTTEPAINLGACASDNEIAIKQPQQNFAVHDKDGESYHDTTLVPTKLTCGSDFDVVSHRSVCTTVGGEDFKPTVWWSATLVSEDTGSVNLNVTSAVNVRPDMSIKTGRFEGWTFSVEVIAHSVILQKLNLVHSGTDVVPVEAWQSGNSLAFSYSCNVLIKSTEESGHGEEHKHVYDHVNYPAQQQHTFDESAGRCPREVQGSLQE